MKTRESLELFPTSSRRHVDVKDAINMLFNVLCVVWATGNDAVKDRIEAGLSQYGIPYKVEWIEK